MSVRYVRSCGAGMPPPPRHCYYNITNLMLYINIKYGHFLFVMFYVTYHLLPFMCIPTLILIDVLFHRSFQLWSPPELWSPPAPEKHDLPGTLI